MALTKVLLFGAGVFLVCLSAAVTSAAVCDVETAGKIMRMADLYGIDSTGGDIWAVGPKGMIFHTVNMGKTWDLQETGIGNELFSVSFADNHGWAVGRFGVVLHTEDRGEHWEVQQREIADRKPSLYKVQFVNATTGWAVGEWGTIIHTVDGGKSWTSQSLLTATGEGEDITGDESPEEEAALDQPDDEGIFEEEFIEGDEAGDALVSAGDKFLYGLYFVNSECGWVVGESGTIGHTADGGNTWVLQESPQGRKSLYSVYFRDVETGWACGIDGTIIYTNDGGDTWNAASAVPTEESLYDVVLHEEVLWTVGKKGIILSSADGGKTWKFGDNNPVVYYWLIDLVSAEGNLIIAGGHGAVLISPDGGRTW
ncbi:MAG: hypothetical protein JXD19_07850 [Deltaproteobacteria bacterium]|nr:hypothetical protein [Deltaproteobacteria bacterium]